MNLTELLGLVEDLPDYTDEYIWDSPMESKWVFGVDNTGSLFLVVRPNIHPSFFDNGCIPEDIGFPEDAPDKEAGLYNVIASVWSEEPIGGYGDYDSGWDIISMEPLCIPEQPQKPKRKR